MHLHINQADGTPIYLQIVNQIKYLISSGVLNPGAELPPIRALAEQLVINPNTVARAYRELEVAGFLIKKGTAGTFVSDTASPLAQETQIKILEKRIDSLLADAAHMGFSIRDIKKLLDERATLMADTKNKRRSGT
jgi:GntR family transcriptional regulator